MRHRKHNIRLGRQRSHYKATLRHLASGLIISKTITTTKVKAKETSRLADRLVTLGKEDSVFSRRKAYDILRSRDLVSILFKDIAPLFKDRNGGYTRVMLTGNRRGDNAQMAILEFVEKPKVEVVPKKDKKKKIKAEQPQEEKVKPAKAEKEKIEKAEVKKETPKPKPKKAEKKVIKDKELPKKEKKPVEIPKEEEKPKEPEKKPGFFKRLFGRKDK